MRFFTVGKRKTKDGYEVFPIFRNDEDIDDLMIKGNAFYAVWDESSKMWSQNKLKAARIVDKELARFASEVREKTDGTVTIKRMNNNVDGMWQSFNNYIKNMPDMFTLLDSSITFADSETHKEDFVSRKLSYSPIDIATPCYEELISTLYNPEERLKIEWAIGAILSGEAKNIQQFIALYGAPGSGKSTILNIIEALFEGYTAAFDAKKIVNSSSPFPFEDFKNNPLVAIDHDSNMSRITENSAFNALISHDRVSMNEKHKSSYPIRINAFIFISTNSPIEITDAKSGIIRRLIDVVPSGKKIGLAKYRKLVSGIAFELGGIAYHCMKQFSTYGSGYYLNYKAEAMLNKTNLLFNFVSNHVDELGNGEGITLKRAFDLFREFCSDYNVDLKQPKYKFREELKDYFDTYSEFKRVNGVLFRNLYEGFLQDKFKNMRIDGEKTEKPRLSLTSEISIFDSMYGEIPAQYATSEGTPIQPWAEVQSRLSDIDTRQIHYTKPPENHIVVDFDLKDESGEKNKELNLEAAANFPPTYAEFSKGEAGVHLHYIYEGDVTKLSRVYSDDIEIKTFIGGSSLRRKLTRCNRVPIAHISSGLPLKGEKKMVGIDVLKSEKGLRALILRNLRKEILPGTKPSMDFIKKILDDAYNSDLTYDVSDMRHQLLAFASNSTNRAEYCIGLLKDLKLTSETVEPPPIEDKTEAPLVFFDVEVFPNLLIVNWKLEGVDSSCVRMVNPSSAEVERLFSYKLVGFNCRRYDNHILYGRYIGYTNEQLYQLSSRIISGSSNVMFGEAYNLSYTDVYDFSSVKQSLKKFQIELGIHHQELGLPWDQPVPEEKWIEVAEYCDNDVIATEAVFNARKEDWIGRQILADLAGMSVNDTTNSLTTRIIFGEDKKPQVQFNYRNLGEFVGNVVPLSSPADCDSSYSVFSDNKPIFPGYKFDHGKSTYRGEVVGEGGYVYAEPGIYFDVKVLDVASMHPSSIYAENLFGEVYTGRFKALLDARIAIKHSRIDEARMLFDGKLNKYLNDEEATEGLAQALKLAINSVYGLTAAKFDHPFKDKRNIDNIVAKRGALFMINLKNEVQKKGYQVCHIKTDSIKIPNGDPEVIDFIIEYGYRYGYTFEHEATYDRMCLVNDSVFISKYEWASKKKLIGTWSATGAQFAHPYVFKYLFSKEKIEFKDLCEPKSVTTTLYLDMNETLSEDEHAYCFVGKTGLFVPIRQGCGGGLLMREKEGKYYSVTGTKGYRWAEAEKIMTLEKKTGLIDESYHKQLVDEAITTISKYGDFEMFVSDQRWETKPYVIAPWEFPCQQTAYEFCNDCPIYEKGVCKEGYTISDFVEKEGNGKEMKV